MVKTTEVLFQSWDAPAQSSLNSSQYETVLPLVDIPTDVPTLIKTGINALDCARTVNVFGPGSDNTVEVTLTGTDIFDQPITEVVVANGSESTRAFKTLDSVLIATSENGGQVSIALGIHLGLAAYCDEFSFCLSPTFVPTFDSNEISLNTVSNPKDTLLVDESPNVAVVYIPLRFPAYNRVWG